MINFLVGQLIDLSATMKFLTESSINIGAKKIHEFLLNVAFREYFMRSSSLNQYKHYQLLTNEIQNFLE